MGICGGRAHNLGAQGRECVAIDDDESVSAGCRAHKERAEMDPRGLGEIGCAKDREERQSHPSPMNAEQGGRMAVR